MRRREFITLLGGVAAAWPLAARAQRAGKVPRIGMLTDLPENDPESAARLAAFRKALIALGWVKGKNKEIDIRWGIDADLIRRNAMELVALAPDVILANGPPAVLAVQQASRTVPIIFTATTDPVALGLVQSLARPGGNATGFTSAEFGMSAKWLELLKEISPDVSRVGVVEELSNPSSIPQFVAIQTVASSFGVELTRISLRDATEIERGIAVFAGTPKGGLIVTRTAETVANRDLIIKLAAQRFFHSSHKTQARTYRSFLQ
jgi:putative tryptophan/tyrosine transport system substrate-binding protein